MLPVLIAVLSMIVIGLPIALAVDRSARGPLLLGTAFLYGSGWIFLAMLALAIAHVQWTVLLVTIAALLPLALLFKTAYGARVAGHGARVTGHGARVTGDGSRVTAHFRAHWLDIPTLVSIAGFALFATGAALWEWDFWAIWGMKARVFLERGGIDWRFLQSPWNAYVHPDYPLLVPLNFDFAALLNGAWSDRWLGVLSVAWAFALLLIVRDLAARESTVVPAALVTLAVTGLAASRYPGLAEGPMIAYGSAAVLFIRRALQAEETNGAPAPSGRVPAEAGAPSICDAADWRHGALLLGLAANVKNEGVALLVAVAIAIAIVRPRALVRLWPAAALAAPWLILRAAHTLPTDIVSGSATARVMARLPHAGMILLYIARHLYEPWFWLAVLAGVMILPAAMRRRERFVILATIIQIVFYIGSYFATPHELRWHVATSWSRLTDQIATPITVAVFLTLANYAAGGQESAGAEARSIE